VEALKVELEHNSFALSLNILEVILEESFWKYQFKILCSSSGSLYFLPLPFFLSTPSFFHLEIFLIEILYFSAISLLLKCSISLYIFFFISNDNILYFPLFLFILKIVLFELKFN
jgi:hypothetical protein